MSQQNPYNPNQPQQPQHGHTGQQNPAWGHPQYGHTYPGNPVPPMPPRPPKKGLNGWAIAGITAAGLVVALGVLGAIVGPQDTSDGKASSDVAAAPTTEKPTPAPSKAEPSKAAPKKETPAAKPTHKPKPAPPKPKTYTNGDYVVGEDIPEGTYTTPGAEKGIFEVCMVSTDPTNESTWPQLKSANADERIIITLKKSDGVVSISGCEPLTPRK